MESVVPLSDIAGLAKSKSHQQLQSAYGAKAAFLSQANASGLTIPNGFVITTEGYRKFVEGRNQTIPESMWNSISQALGKLERETNLKYGGENPLLLSVSGVFPAPGAICVGLNDYTVRMMEKKTNNRAFAFDCYRRFIRSYGALVCNIANSKFDEVEEKYLESRNLGSMTRTSALDQTQLTKLFKAVIVQHSGKPLTQNVTEQLKSVVLASMLNYSKTTSVAYRSAVHESTQGAAVLVTQMIFGSASETGYAGAMSTHNLTTGEAKPNGVYAKKAFVEDATEEVVDVFTIQECADLRQLQTGAEKMSKLVKQPVTIEFASENGKLHVVRAMPSKFAGYARFTAAAAMVKSSAISRHDALTGLSPADFNSLMNKTLKSKPKSSFCNGTAGARGTANGVIADDAASDKDVIVVGKTIRNAACLVSAKGCISATGGNYSRSAYHARALNKPAVVGCKDLTINYDEKSVQTKNGLIAFGDIATISENEAYLATLPTLELEAMNADAKEVLRWADEARAGKISVLASVESSDEAEEAVFAGADGIGMLSLDKMMLSDRESVVKFFLTKDSEFGTDIENRLSSQLSDVLSVVSNQSVSIKLFNAPLSEFLPSAEQLTADIAALNVRKQYEKGFNKDDELRNKEELMKLVTKVIECSPSLASRGAQLCVGFPDFFTMQVRAVMTAIKAAKRRGASLQARILIPGVADASDVCKLESAFNDVLLETGETAQLGILIDSPRLCLACPASDFLLIDADRLSEMTYGCTDRAVVGGYLEDCVLEESPCTSVDQLSVGKLMKMCVENARKVSPGVVIHVAGNNCCDQKSIDFCRAIGVSAVTCNVVSVPAVRLCAASVL